MSFSQHTVLWSVLVLLSLAVPPAVASSSASPCDDLAHEDCTFLDGQSSDLGAVTTVLSALPGNVLRECLPSESDDNCDSSAILATCSDWRVASGYTIRNIDRSGGAQIDESAEAISENNCGWRSSTALAHIIHHPIGLGNTQVFNSNSCTGSCTIRVPVRQEVPVAAPGAFYGPGSEVELNFSHTFTRSDNTGFARCRTVVVTLGTGQGGPLPDKKRSDTGYFPC